MRFAARLTLTICLSVAIPAWGESDRDMLARLMDGTPPQDQWFASDFTAAVPVAEVERLVDRMLNDFGPLQSIELAGGRGELVLDRARVPVTIILDPAGRIAGLWFGPPKIEGAGTASIAADLRAAGAGQLAVLALRGEREVVAENADQPMAVGSAFKLLVLRAYEDAVAAGRIGRDDVVPLTAQDLSLPSGVVQDLAPGTGLTLDSLAGLMLSVSDNTATDMLLRILGRDAVEVLSPRNRPFLSTGDLFRLQGAGADTLDEWAAADPERRRQMQAALADAPLPDPAALHRPVWDKAEWYLTANEICDLLLGLREAPALNGPPNALVATEGWRWIGFKGGSEFGVLNLSAAGITPDGRPVCAVVTANAQTAQPEDRIAPLFAALFRSLGTE